MASQVGTYARSELLTPEENGKIERMYAPKREVLAVSVAQLFHAAPNPRVWSKQQTGVVALVKDHNQRSYFLHFVNLDTHQITYTEEMYLELEYKTAYPYFHTFPGEKCMVGLNFCHDGEANNFRSAVQGVVVRNKKRKEKMDQANRPPPVSHAPAPVNTPPVSSIPDTGKPDKKDKKSKKDKKKKGKKGGISKADISGPSNFQHLSHLGWDKSKNQFDETQIDPALRELLNTAGIKTSALKDESTAEFIKSFVDNYGGMETLKEKSRRSTVRSASASSHGRAPPPAPPGHDRGPPPPAPGRHKAGPPPPTRHAQPPPPPGRQGPPPPPTTKRVAPPAPGAPRAPPAPPAPNAPPAPPPPPPPGPGAPPAPRAPRAPAAPRPAAPAGAPAPQTGRGNLLDEIKRGKALKSASEPIAGQEDTGAGGGDLLSEIRNFKGGLKRGAERQPSAPEQAAPDELEGMAAALARALGDRKEAFKIERNDSDDSDEESDDDWSD